MKHDAIIIGGGFYGCSLAIYLAQQKGLKNILILEQESKIMQRASYTNQARVHNGYHYPRSFTTAYRSRINLPRFVKHWPDAIVNDFEKLYAIPKTASKVTAKQFFRFCSEIGAEVSIANPKYSGLFDDRRTDQVYSVKEFAFDTSILAQYCVEDMEKAGIQLHLEERVTGFTSTAQGCEINTNKSSYLSAFVFNCTYAGITHIPGYPKVHTGIKQEITEMALLQVPKELEKVGITVMDGPFFSVMPFPARKLHTLSHVRYTPHTAWPDNNKVSPYEKLDKYPQETRVDRMIRDTARYLPCISNSEYRDSLFEVKTILQKNEGDDGRPILFNRHKEDSRCFSILGGKIDNIFDVFERMDNEIL